MKKKLSAAAVSLFSVMAYSQVGINNSSPKATLDVTAKTTDGSKPEGIIAPRLTGDQIKSADGQYGSDQKGTIIYATAAVTSSSAKTVNITTEGYYYFDGAKWQKVGNTAAANSWGLNGNAGTDPAVNFIGTTDSKDIVFKSGSDFIGYIDNSGQSNTSLGWNAGNHSPNNGGMGNTSLGYGAGYSLTSVASSNVLAGLTAGQNIQTGSANTGVGTSALTALISGNNNVAVGMNAGLNVTTGGGNTLIGQSAGDNITTGINNIILGKDQKAAVATDSYQLNIGGAIFGTGISGNANAPAGNIGLGTASPQSRLHIVGDGGTSDDLVINSGSNSQTSSGLYAFYRSRGSYSTPSAVADGDWLGTGSYQGYDGNNFQGGARIGAVVNGTVSSGSVPTDLLFATGNTAINERVRITSDGNVGIATSSPTQKLDVDGTARLRNIPSSGGTVMLTADNDGVIRKQALPAPSAPTILPATTTSGVNLTPSNWNTPNYTGTSITIPANSKYIVTSNQVLGTNNANSIMPAGQSVWLQTTFSDSPTNFQYSSDIQGSSLISGVWGSSNQYGTITGAIILNNTSSSAKTYYYWAVKVVNNGYSGEISNFGGSGWGENQIYAIPVN